MSSLVGIREKLILVKMLIEEATYNSTINTTFNRSLSIIQAHQAIEWIFRLILLEKGQLKYQPKELDKVLNSPFPKLLPLVKGISSLDSPEGGAIIDKYSALILKIKDARDIIYHRAIVDVDASELVGGVQQMLRELCEKVLAVGWDEISLVAAIRNEEWKKIAEEAELTLKRNDYEHALRRSWDLIQTVLEESAAVAGQMTRAWLSPVFQQDIQAIIDILEPDEYARRYSIPEVKALALDMSKAVYMIGFLTTNLALLNEEERLKYVKTVNAVTTLQPEAEQGSSQLAPTALEAFDFAVRMTLKLEKLLRITKGP